MLTPNLRALIAWRDSKALDWSGDELIHHIVIQLHNARPKDIPHEHRPALLEFKSLDYNVQCSMVEEVVEPPMPPPINLGTYHEVMDRAALLQDTWSRELATLPTVLKHHKLKKRAEKVMDQMIKFYQLAGEVYFEMEEKEEWKTKKYQT